LACCKRANNFDLNNQRAEYGKQIVVTLSRYLSWSHFLAIIPLKTPEKQQFYAIQAAQQNWSVRELRKQIKNKCFERTEIANSQFLPEKNDMRDAFKDPYFLNSLRIKDGYLEKDLENAIIKDIEEFILEIGKGFAFIERQKRMIIAGKDFYLDAHNNHRK
jgi:predicted nuclease of restriction endonuclease-like (RecB) superfamily